MFLSQAGKIQYKKLRFTCNRFNFSKYLIIEKNMINILALDKSFEESLIKNTRLLRLIKLSLFSVTIAVFFIVAVFSFNFYLVTIITLTLLGYFVVFLLTTRYYNWPLILFCLVFLGLYYKKMHWPFSASIMSIGTVLLGSVSWFNSFKFLSSFRENGFLKWIGFVSGIIVALFMMGFLFKNMAWPGAYNLLASGSFLLVLTVLALVFTLPYSNYIAWSGIERKVLFRSVLVPLLFVFSLFTLFIVFNDAYNEIMGKFVYTPRWLNNEVVLFNLEGIITK
jgi:hypothetical protein